MSSQLLVDFRRDNPKVEGYVIKGSALPSCVVPRAHLSSKVDIMEMCDIGKVKGYKSELNKVERNVELLSATIFDSFRHFTFELVQALTKGKEPKIRVTKTIRVLELDGRKKYPEALEGKSPQDVLYEVAKDTIKEGKLVKFVNKEQETDANASYCMITAEYPFKLKCMRTLDKLIPGVNAVITHRFIRAGKIVGYIIEGTDLPIKYALNSDALRHWERNYYGADNKRTLYDMEYIISNEKFRKRLEGTNTFAENVKDIEVQTLMEMQDKLEEMCKKDNSLIRLTNDIGNSLFKAW